MDFPPLLSGQKDNLWNMWCLTKYNLLTELMDFSSLECHQALGVQDGKQQQQQQRVGQYISTNRDLGLN